MQKTSHKKYQNLFKERKQNGTIWSQKMKNEKQRLVKCSKIIAQYCKTFPNNFEELLTLKTAAFF